MLRRRVLDIGRIKKERECVKKMVEKAGKKSMRYIGIFLQVILTGMLLVSCGEKELPPEVLLANSLTEAKKGNWENAEKFSSSVLKKDGNNVHALILQALAMHNTDRLQEAMESISQAVKLAPNDFHTQYLKGYFAYKAGKYKEAVRPLSVAQHLMPGEINSLILLAQTHYKLKNDRLAVSFYKKMAIHPKYKTSALPVNALGILFARSNPRLAERYFQEAAKRAKIREHLLTTLNTGIFYEVTRKKKQAVTCYRRFISETKGKSEYDPLREQVINRLNDL